MKAIRIVLHLVPDITHVYHSQNYDNLRPMEHATGSCIPL